MTNNFSIFWSRIWFKLIKDTNKDTPTKAKKDLDTIHHFSESLMVFRDNDLFSTNAVFDPIVFFYKRLKQQ